MKADTICCGCINKHMTEAETATKKWGAHVLNFKLWWWGLRLHIIRSHESKQEFITYKLLEQTISLVSWGLGGTTIHCRGRAVDQTTGSGSIAQCSAVQCCLIPGKEMILYFSYN